MAQMKRTERPRIFVCRYMADVRIEQRLKATGKDPVVPFYWDDQAPDIAADDIIILWRGRARSAKDPSADGPVGLTGWARAQSGPTKIENQKTKRAVSARVLAHSPSAVPVESYWHDHRLAGTADVFGQQSPTLKQGLSFLIEPEAADALFERLAEASVVPGLADLPHTGSTRDALTERIDRVTRGTTLLAVRALNSARALAAVSVDRPHRVNWPRLLVGLLKVGSRLRKDAKTGTLLRIAAEIATTQGTQRVDDYIAELADRQLDLEVLGWELATPVIDLSPSAGKALDQAATLAGSRPVSGEALLAALLTDSVHYGDEAYQRLFGLDRKAFLDRLMSEGRSRARPADVAAFERWLDGSGSSAPAAKTSTPDPEATSASNPAVGPRVAGTLNDTVKHGEDFLDVRHEARAFARLIASSGFEPPLAIGVFGHWGSGKTFFMERIAEELDRFDAAAGTSGVGNAAMRHIVPIRFNAWHYMETNVWASLVDVIFRELDGWLRRAARAAPPSGGSVDQLFESLSTAQAERLEAIEAVAERLGAREQARQRVADAGNARESHWKTVAETLAGSDFEESARALGLSPLIDEGEKLRLAIGSVQAAGSDAGLLWASLRSRAADPRWLLILIALLATAPLLFGWIGERLADEPAVAALTGLVTAAAVWTTALANNAKTAVAAMRRLHEVFQAVEEQRRAAREDTLAQHENQVAEAQRLLTGAEAAAAEAQRRLFDGSAAGRIAAFIRSRAEGDTYSKHLGIIATVRRDFEQLTALMAESRRQARQEMEALDRQRADTQTRIDALRARYLGEKVAPAVRESFRPVAEALDRLEHVNAHDNPLGISIGRIVLFVDDLDRCPPKSVYRVLQAVHLFLSFPLFVVIVGVDTRWMEASLEKELEGLVDSDGGGATPQDYLEKIFQIPYWTRRMDEEASGAFVDGVLGRLPTGEPAPADRGSATVTEPAARPDRAPDAGPEVVDETDDQAEEDATAEDATADGDEETVEQGTRPAAPQITRFEPVVLTKAERDMIRELAPEAGRSPRQLLRFVNIYGLIKSIEREDGAAVIDPAADDLRFKALLAQLAIATGASRAADAYFEALVLCAGTIRDLQNRLEEGMRRHAVPASAAQTVRNALTHYLSGDGRDVDPSSEPGGADGAPDEDSARLVEELRSTAGIARRYTFAAIGARAAAADGGTGPGGTFPDGDPAQAGRALVG